MNEETKTRLKQSGSFGWVPWFRALTENIAEGGEKYLVDKARKVDWIKENPSLLSYGAKGIDPFSFIYFLASKNTKNQRKPVFSSVHEVFELSGELSKHCPTEGVITEGVIIPTPTPVSKSLFHDGKNFDSNLLWALFRQAIEPNPEVLPETFSRVLKMPDVGVSKLTQSLFLINPRKFFSIDKKISEHFLAEYGNVETKINKDGYSRYFEFCNKIKVQFPECDLFEINQIIFILINDNIINPKSKFYEVNTDSFTDGTDSWDTFSEFSCVTVNQSADLIFEPQQGDVLLMRFGANEGRGIGVVLKNEYKEKERNYDQSVIHVNWINKSSSILSSIQSEPSFCEVRRDSPTYSAFADSAEYASTMELISKHLTAKESDVAETTPLPYGTHKPKTVDHSLNTILYGPPGTGKTYKTAEYCVRICVGLSGNSGSKEIRRQYKSLVSEGRVQFVTFHQSYSYEEFVEGLRPKPNEVGGIRLVPEDGILKKIATEARNNKDKSYVLVIDEINRANISRVLGELITLLEEDKREGQKNEVVVQLPYSNKAFSLPVNLHILGTMNTADRSIALLDTALRRRFDFDEVMPKPELLKEASERTEVNLSMVLQSINNRVEFLKDRDHLIGHAWLMKAKDRDDLDRIMRKKIIPLLVEFFHDDWQSVKAILGDTNDFVQCEPLSPPPGIDKGSDDRFRWTIRDSFPEDAYNNLIGNSTSDSN